MDIKQFGIEAQRYLDSPQFKTYLASAEQAILDEIAVCPIRDVEGLRLLQMHYRFIRGIEASLMGFAQTGRFESVEPKGIRRIVRKLLM